MTIFNDNNVDDDDCANVNDDCLSGGRWTSSALHKDAEAFRGGARISHVA